MPIGTSIGVAIVCLLYLLVNVAYVSMLYPSMTMKSLSLLLQMIVVPKSAQLDPSTNVALAFIRMTFGSLSGDDNQSQRILSAFMAISSFGNIVVMTFTAARGATLRSGSYNLY
jgi:amino acid transporter